MANQEETNLPENQRSLGLTPSRNVFPIADFGQSYGQQQAEKNLRQWQGMSGTMRQPSDLASPEERAAYTAQEVRSGNLPEYMLPEDYGGMPRGTSRRAYRARQQWMAEQNYVNSVRDRMAREEQAAFERGNQIEEEKYNRELRKLELYNKRFNLERSNLVLNDSNEFLKTITGEAVDENGNPIPPIRVSDPDARERMRAAMIKHKYAAEDPRTKGIIDQFYKDIEAEVTTRQELGANAGQKIINDAIAAGVSDEQIAAMQRPDPTTGNVGYDYAGIQRLAAETKRSERTRQKQETGAYRPTSLAEAEDQLAEAEAELGALTPQEGEDGSEAYTNAQKRVASLKERVKRAAQREGVQLPANKQEGQPEKKGDKTTAAGYVVGTTYEDKKTGARLTYLGGDPTKSENWKKIK